MSRPMPLPPGPPPRLQVDYVDAATPAQLLAQPDVLAVLGFGQAPCVDDPRYLRVPLQPHGAAPFEVWRAQAPVRTMVSPAPANTPIAH